MQTNSEAKLLRIFIGESDKVKGKPVYEEIVLRARESGSCRGNCNKRSNGFRC
jgi:PII-like signaling protein